MRRYLKIMLVAFLLLNALRGASWAVETGEPPFLNCMGKTVDEVIALYGAPRLTTSEEVVLGFAFKEVPSQGRFYDVTYYVMGYRVVGVYYEVCRTDAGIHRERGDWFDAYMGKPRQDIGKRWVFRICIC